MRSISILLAGLLLLASTPALAADDRPAEPQLMARVLGALLERAGLALTGDGNELKPTAVDGTGNTVFNVDELVVNFNVGDVNVAENYGGSEEIAHRLVDLLMERAAQRDRMRGERRGMAMFAPPNSGRAFGWGWRGHGMGAPGWKQNYRDHFSREPGPDSRAEYGDTPPRRGPHDWSAEFWGPGAAGVVEPQPHPSPEVLELLMQIPPDVEPAFVAFIMHVGQLAREQPHFHEALEKLVEQTEAQLKEAETLHPGHPEHGEHAEARH